MSRAVVVFESMFGNTEAVARAIAGGLGVHLPVEVIEVGAAPARLDDDVSLVVVGGPTHAFGISRSSTRQDAAGRRAEPPISSGIGVREWLEAVEVRPGLACAAFGTRVATPWVPGSAARAIGRRLRTRGLRLVTSPRSFHVTGTEGPLVDGEQERARGWGEDLALARADARG